MEIRSDHRVVDFNELYNPRAEAKADGKRRRRGGKGKTEGAAASKLYHSHYLYPKYL